MNNWQYLGNGKKIENKSLIGSLYLFVISMDANEVDNDDSYYN